MFRDGIQGERREYFRVEGQVRLYYRKLEEPEDSQASKELCDLWEEASLRCGNDSQEETFCSLELSEKELLLEIIRKLAGFEKRLEKMQELLSRSLPGPGVPLRPCFVNISGCGMRFPTKERFQVGDQIEVSVELPMTPNHLIRMVGEVVHVLETPEQGENPPSYQTAVRFISVNDTDRERIVRYTIHRQYDLINQARKSG